MGFGIKKEAGSSTTPSDIVNFDKLTPTTPGVVFTPNTPATLDILYVSSVDASTWIWNGTAYITYSAPATATTEWYLYGTTIDAGSNKTAPITRNNAIYTVGYDSFFNTVRVGRGRGNIITNTVVGNSAGQSISTGSDNSFFGTNSGNFNSSGNFNIFFGTYAGYSTTTTNSNTFVGYSAGYNNDGDNNVFLGSNSGRYITGGVTALTTSTNSVFLGGETKALANGQTNQIIIGYNTIGKGSNTVNIGNTSITNTYLNGAVTFNNAFTFPTTDGTANYFLKTNGSGTVTWGVAGLSFFSEAQSTTAPNATVYANSLTAVSTTTNADFVIKAKGAGAILAQIPDNTTTGGTKRGAYAVDFSMIRGGSTQVASGSFSTVSGGHSNNATNTYSTSVGGFNNISSGSGSIAGGNSCTASGDNSVALGRSCTASNSSTVALGSNSVASQVYAVAIGYGANSTANHAVSLGRENTVSNYSGFGCGVANTVSGENAFSANDTNTSSGYSSFVFGGKGSSFGITNRFVMGGYGTTLGSNQSSKFMLGLRTTDATASPLVINYIANTTPSNINQLVLQNNNVFRVKGSITGKQSGSTNVGVWDIDCVIVRGANAASTVIAGTPTVSLVVNTGGFGNPTLTANTTLGCLTVTVIGALATNVQWTCVIDTCETIYA